MNDQTGTVVVLPGEGTSMSFTGPTKLLLKMSSADLGVVEVTVSAGEEPPYHVHTHEDEWFYVIEGELEFHEGERNFPAPQGSFISAPRGHAHTYSVLSGTARLLQLNTPGGFECMFLNSPGSIEAAAAPGGIFEQFGVRPVAPHPRNGSYTK